MATIIAIAIYFGAVLLFDMASNLAAATVTAFAVIIGLEASIRTTHTSQDFSVATGNISTDAVIATTFTVTTYVAVAVATASTIISVVAATFIGTTTIAAGVAILTTLLATSFATRTAVHEGISPWKIRFVYITQTMTTLIPIHLYSS